MKKFSIHPVSVIVWIWMFVVLGINSAMCYILAITIHEFGHYFVAKKLGYKLKKFSLSPYGASLDYSSNNFENFDEIKIALAGPFANFLSIIFVLAFWWVFPEIYFFTNTFVFVSFIIALFNMLPAYPLDFGRVFVRITSSLFSEKTAKKITIIFNFLLAIFFLVAFVVCCFVNFNPTLILFAVFLILGMIEIGSSSKYERVNIFQKTFKNFAKPALVLVHENTSIKELLKFIKTQKNHVFCVVFENGKIVFLSEERVKNLCLVCDINVKISELYS